ncbi:unnamed protein product [Polarella glacialis]|uniref:Uncharacterized protein n=1 Tax=Polarella glacialis TaxID=89957 RepID=A0A813HPC4_POLGL|nr:unnamed protein product [Polarella glacialis]
MCMFNFGCSDCKPTDPATSTVKVDLKDLASGPEAERLEQDQMQSQQQAAAQQTNDNNNNNKNNNNNTNHSSKTQEKEASEALRQAERQAAARQAAKRLERPLRLSCIAEAAAAEDEQERRQLEQECLEREHAVATFLKLHGFTGVNSCKRIDSCSTFPLHKAAEAGDDKMVSLLCRAGAKPTQKNSCGKTPAQVAQTGNKSGSHFKVLTVLATPDDAAPYAGQQSAGGA